jgi:F420-non-reducing hydrogenase iron-sulfur subunit
MGPREISLIEFEPKIVGFLCNWCSYAGADLAGVSRLHYPPNIRVIRVMCSGRVDPSFILEAFRQGADGVLIAGCHLPSDCHYVSGNFKAQRRVLMTKALLEKMGIEPERLRLEWISAAEGGKFAEVIKQMTNELKRLGPNPLKSCEDAVYEWDD